MKKNNDAGVKSGFGRSESSVSCDNLSFAAREAYKRLRTNVMISLPNEGKCRVIGVTSSAPHEGKSLTAVNLAYSISQLDKRVLLLDADMRKSTVHKKMALKLSPGLRDLLTGADTIDNVLQTFHSDVTGASVDVIAGGEPCDNASELLNSKPMIKLLSALTNVYDYVIVDLPPVGAVIDAVSVSKHLDGMLVVVRENYCTNNMLTDTLRQLDFAGINILGFVLNGALEGAGKKYKYGKYSSGYGRSYYGSSNYGYGYGYSNDRTTNK